MTSGIQEFVKRVVFTTDRCSKGVRHLFRLKRACKTEAYWKIRICVSAGLSICFAVLFYFCALFRFASGLEGTGKGVAMKKVNRNNGVIDVTTVGGRIKKLRTDAGYTQEELAARLHLEGKSAISNYENNSRGVSAEMLTQLSRLFHVSADYILNGDSPDNLDPIVNEAIEILNNLKTDKAKKSALAMLRQIQILEG